MSPIGIAACEAGIVVSDSRRGDLTLLDRNLQPIATLVENLERPTGVACAGGPRLRRRDRSAPGFGRECAGGGELSK